jgi:hypothetical protein
MVFEIKKSQGTFQSFVNFFDQFFHDNCLFFEAFEIVITTNFYYYYEFFQKIETNDS